MCVTAKPQKYFNFSRAERNVLDSDICPPMAKEKAPNQKKIVQKLRNKYRLVILNDDTFEEKLKAMMVDRGMFDNQADVVMDKVKTIVGESMDRRWDESIENYPDTVLIQLWLIAKEESLNYLNENLPLAWFKPMFE